MTGSEILGEMQLSGEAPPQCCGCNQTAEHQCECREHLCADHSFECDLCHKHFCRQHVLEVERTLFVCAACTLELKLETARVLAAERILEEVMA